MATVKYNSKLKVWEVKYYGVVLFSSTDELIAYAYAKLV